MQTLTLRLDEVNWDAVAGAIRDRRRTGGGADAGNDAPAPHVLADAESLAALFARDFGEGLGRIAAARAAEPLNPIHAIRLVLWLLRFGASGRALALAQSLQDQLPGLALPGYLRALAIHRQDEFKRAANVAGEVVAAHPGFALARFLQAEAQLRSQFKGLKKLLAGLPRGEAHAPAWADLVAKLVLAGSDEGRSTAAEVAANPACLPPGSRAQALAARVVALGRAGLDALEAELAAAPAGSRAEELVLLFYHDRLDAERRPEAAVETLRRLVERLDGRKAVRRLHVARLTRLAIDLAAADRHAEALRLVERCLELEPHETVHYQNRAALFSQLREPGAYHDAWYELDRHQYRLALLGKVTAGDAQSLAKPHRLFAQQARLPASGAGAGSRAGQDLGFLVETTRTHEGTTDTLLAVNQDRIDDDPDLLRQWIHHRRAELTFSHWALGMEPRRFLLDPENARAAEARRAGLAACARSLETLVPEEGRLLAGRLVSAWDRRAGDVDPAYAPPPDDPEVRALRLLHLETLGDLALLCLNWKPDGLRPALVEEVLSTLAAEGPFFDDTLLREVLQGNQSETSYALKLLAGFTNDALGLDPGRPNALTDRQRAELIGRLAAELLVRLAYQTYETYRGSEGAARRALAFIERARAQAPENVRTELVAARFLVLAGADDESRAALAKLQRSARSRDPEIHSEIEELRKILDERGQGAAGKPGRPVEAPDAPAPAGGAIGAQVAELEAEIDRFPAAIQAYEELVRKLAADGRFRDAIEWSERATAQCLGREGQLRARSLEMEAGGLRLLGERDQGAVRLYATGAHRPALELLEAIPEAEAPDYTLSYLLGNCRLALGRPEDARQAYERALELCGRQLHRTVLRALARDVDQPYLAVARRAIADRLGAGAYEDALRAAWEMLARLRSPEPAYVDLAQIHLDAAVARLGTGPELEPEPLATPAPAEHDLARRGGPLAEAYAATTDLERARRLARLSLEVDEPSRRKAELILRKAEALEKQAALAEVLARSGTLLRRGRFDDALAALDDAGPDGADEPRLVRQRALLLLKLDRFAEAEAVADALRGSATPVAREFLAGYPALACRQRIAAGCRLLRAGEAAEALRILDGAPAVDGEQAIELAYCRGFALTMEAYRHRRAGRADEARGALTAAMDRVEPHVAAARASGHARLIELYETLDKELDR